MLAHQSKSMDCQNMANSLNIEGASKFVLWIEKKIIDSVDSTIFR